MVRRPPRSGVLRVGARNFEDVCMSHNGFLDLPQVFKECSSTLVALRNHYLALS